MSKTKDPTGRISDKDLAKARTAIKKTKPKGKGKQNATFRKIYGK